MSTKNHLRDPSGAGAFAVLLALGLCSAAFAQTNTNTMVPMVTVRATDANATWAGDPGLITFIRMGPTNATLSVYYRIGGTASNGVDYALIPNWIQIPAGLRTNSVAINPINKGQTNIALVSLTLVPPPIMPPVNYLIGSPSNAAVTIRPSLTNVPPMVRIVVPTNDSIFPAPAKIPICADARDRDGWVVSVEFFAGTNSIGVRTNNPMGGFPMNPFCLVWSNVPPGDYSLTALATDNGGASTLSGPVHVLVSTNPPPPLTNYPPVVRISSPANGAMFRGPLDLPIFAYAQDRDDAIATVEFFAGTNSLGLGQPVQGPVLTNRPPCALTNMYVLVWSNAPLGSHVLTGLATDTRGASSRSGPVAITIWPAPPPPTNRPPVVSIVATDPIAIEGTNCWVWRAPTNKVVTWSNWWTGVLNFFTNCGPKNATLTVRRAGVTNDELTVAYDIGGTATNGVDYVALPGSVTIPAGARAAQITIIPIDDGVTGRTSTVVLRLTPPPTNLPPAYLLGWPRSAAALIVDSSKPWPPTGLLAGGLFSLSAAGPDGAWFTVESSADMVNWAPVCTSQVVNGQISFVDPDAASAPQKFYRTVPEQGPADPIGTPSAPALSFPTQ